MKRKITKIDGLREMESNLPVTKSREKCNLLEMMNNGYSPFKKNAISQGRDLALIAEDKILAVGMTQIGKQTMMLNQTMFQYLELVQSVRENKVGGALFINFDYACASSKNLVAKKKEDRGAFWKDYTFQRNVPYLEIIGHNDDLVKAIKHPDKKVIECLLYRGDEVTSELISLDDIKNQIDSRGAFANVQLDEIHQYKTLDGALHTFLKDYIGVRLTKNNRENCKVVCVTATPFDTMAFLKELNIPPEIFRPKWLYPPEGYYGWENFEEDGLFDDFDYYAKKAKEKYENNPEEKNRYLNYAVLWWVMDHYERFMNSSSKDSIVIRNPYTGRKSKEKREHLEGLLKSMIASQPFGNCKVLKADAKKENKVSRNLFESRVGIKKETSLGLASFNVDDWSLVAVSEKAIFLIVDLYGVGVSVKTESVYGWCEPEKKSTDATYTQRCGRPCGSDKRGNGTRLCASKARLLYDLGVAYKEYSENEKDINILAVKTSGTHSVAKKQTPLYEHKIVDSVSPIYKAKLSSHHKFNALNLSTRGAKKALDFQKLVKAGEINSPSALAKQAIEAAEGDGLTLRNICFPNEYGGEVNCSWEGRSVYGQKIDGPCIYATEEEKEFLKPYIGKFLISYYAGKNKNIPTGTTVVKQPWSKAKSTMLSHYGRRKKAI